MEFDKIITLLFCGASIAAGAFLGAIRSKLFASKTENKFHYVFYAAGGIILLGAIIALICNFSEFFKPNWYGIIGFIIAIGFSTALLFFTKKYLIVKSIYEIAELDPIINSFTSMADKDEIKLFGGDLNFLGNNPSDMDKNNQYSHLKSLNFNKVSILCEEPNDTTKKIRYGKIYNEIKNVELKFYYPEKADLRVRGRIINVNGSIRLLMYTKSSPGKYQALETDTGNTGGALYDNIWKLAWFMATAPSLTQIQAYKDLYNK